MHFKRDVIAAAPNNSFPIFSGISFLSSVSFSTDYSVSNSDVFSFSLRKPPSVFICGQNQKTSPLIAFIQDLLLHFSSHLPQYNCIYVVWHLAIELLVHWCTLSSTHFILRLFLSECEDEKTHTYTDTRINKPKLKKK